MALARTAARGALTTLVGQGFKFVLQIASVALLSHLISPTGFGLYGMVASIVSIALVIGDAGLSLAAISAGNLTREQRSNLFWINAALGTLIALVVVALAKPVSLLYSEPRLIGITEGMAIVFFVNGFVPQFRAEATSRLNFIGLTISDVTAQAASIAAAIVVALMGGGYWALVIQQIVLAVVGLICTAIAARWVPRGITLGQRMGSIFAFGTNSLGSQLLNYVSVNADNVLIGRVWGAAPLGIYTRAFMLFQLPLQQIATPMTRVALPVLASLREDGPRFDAYLQRAQLLITYLVGGGLFVLAGVAGPLIEIFLGSRWRDAEYIFEILAIGGVFQALGYPGYWVFLARAQTKQLFRISLVGRSAMVAMMTVGVFISPIGVAVGSMLGQVLLWAMQTFLSMPKMGVNVPRMLRDGSRPVCTGTAIFVACWLTSHLLLSGWNDWAQLGVLLGVAAVLGSVAIAIVPAIRRDLRSMLEVAKHLRSA